MTHVFLPLFKKGERITVELQLSGMTTPQPTGVSQEPTRANSTVTGASFCRFSFSEKVLPDFVILPHFPQAIAISVEDGPVLAEGPHHPATRCDLGHRTWAVHLHSSCTRTVHTQTCRTGSQPHSQVSGICCICCFCELVRGRECLYVTEC